MCQTPSKTQVTYKRTNGQKDLSVRPSVCLSTVSVTGFHPMDRQSAMLPRNLRGGESGIDQ